MFGGADTIGADSCFILERPKLSATIADNTITVSIAWGRYLLQGRYVYGDGTVTKTVSGVTTAGNKRKDAIVVKFTRVNNVESVSYEIVKGTETSGTPSLPIVPDAGGNIELNSTFRMLIGYLNIDGASVSCESLEEYGTLKANRVRSLYNCYKNYIQTLPAVSLKGSCTGKYGSTSTLENILFGILKPIDVLFTKTSNGKLRVIVSDVALIDYLGDVYKVTNDSTFQVEANSYYLAELDIVLDIEKYFNYHDQNTYHSNFPFTTSMKLLKPSSPYLAHRVSGIKIDNDITAPHGQLTLGEVSINRDTQSGNITFKIPLVYVYDFENEVYNINSPDVFRENYILTNIEIQSSNSESIAVQGKVISVTDSSTKLPVRYRVKKEPISAGYGYRETVTLIGHTSSQTVTIAYYPITDGSSLTQVILPTT
jgi:hypothetical protein